jgi:putative alpha-1,2-mannosidase
MDNEPSVGAPWLYLYARRPELAQATVREVLTRLWSDRPHGIPGNDDLGAMSSWYVWAAMGMYPAIPGRAELLLTAPLFPEIEVRRPRGSVLRVEAPWAGTRPYVRGLEVDGVASARSWLAQDFALRGGKLRFNLGAEPDPSWGTGIDDVPPSFGPGG